MLSRKHYEAIADIIHDECHVAGPSAAFDAGRLTAGEDIALGLAALFQDDNPNFNNQRFFEACGVDV